ncbi:uncharacterized protein [Montipora foliosa]|uniref:uncharacterized protein n=1 Tax=Montipora foliosa TaxID=591990 RepID=UPI0035F163F6
MVRRRKQGTPRRTATLTASATSEGEAGPSHTVPEETLPDEPTAPAPPDPRELLLRVEGIEQRRVPKKDSLQRLAQFLREKRPCPHPLETQQETEEATSAEQGQEQPINIRLRNTVVCAGLSKVWEKSKADCTCLAEPMGSGSQGDVADEQCPYCISDMEGSDISAVSSRCENPDCNPCIMMNQLDKTLLAGLGTKRNERLSAFFQLAPCLAKLFNSGELPEDRRKPLVEAFGDLLSCSLTKVRYLSNIGFLIMICPRLQQLQLERGWAIVYNNLSKIASAIGYHGNHNSQLAALIFIREFCIPDRENLWRSYLQSEELVEENRILTEVFAGCFEHSQEDNQSS